MTRWRITIWALSGLLGYLLFGGLGPSFGHGGDSTELIVVIREETEAAIEQISQALTHTLFAWSALRRGDLSGGETHAHHVLNILEGPQGAHYDPSYGGPEEGIGDGIGAQVHAEHLLELLEGWSEGSSYLVAAENVSFFLEEAVPLTLEALKELKADEAVRKLRQVQGMLMAARGSREEIHRPTEGGARTILAWLEEYR